jgi:hypothetical protein
LKQVKLVFKSGAVVEFEAESVEFFLQEYTDATGETKANPNEIGGYKVNGGPEVFWLRPASLEAAFVWDNL